MEKLGRKTWTIGLSVSTTQPHQKDAWRILLSILTTQPIGIIVIDYHCIINVLLFQVSHHLGSFQKTRIRQKQFFFFPAKKSKNTTIFFLRSEIQHRLRMWSPMHGFWPASKKQAIIIIFFLNIKTSMMDQQKSPELLYEQIRGLFAIRVTAKKALSLRSGHKIIIPPSQE